MIPVVGDGNFLLSRGATLLERTMQKTSRVVMLIEPILEDEFRRLAIKKGVSVSSLLRTLVVDELKDQGLLPDEYAAKIFRGELQPI